MNSRAVITLVVAAGIAALVTWIAQNTYWHDEPVRERMHGAALYEPYYAAIRMTHELRADARVVDVLEPLPTDAVMVLANWNWDLTPALRQRLRSWVEGGGRLVVDRTLSHSDDFARWSGIVGEDLQRTAAEARQRRGASRDERRCLDLVLKQGEVPSDPTAALWRLCNVDRDFHWRTTSAVQLSLATADGAQLLRVPVGRGSVTALNGVGTFEAGALLDGDHARLLVIATQLRHGDTLRFLRGDTRISLYGWLWRIAAPLLILLAAIVLLALWRMTMRFGPLLPDPAPARRSLHDQVAGTARFLARNGGAAALWSATREALQSCAAGRLGRARDAGANVLAAQLATLSSESPVPLEEALRPEAARRPQTLVRALAVLERTRRAIQRTANTRSSERGRT
jgi:hypothetical protein